MIHLYGLRVIEITGQEIFKLYVVAEGIELPILETRNVREFSDKVSEISKAYREQTDGKVLRFLFEVSSEPVSAYVDGRLFPGFPAN